jgi:hypothetical protein
MTKKSTLKKRKAKQKLKRLLAYHPQTGINQLEGTPNTDNAQENVEQPPTAIERDAEAIHREGRENKRQQIMEKKDIKWPQRIEAVCAVLLVFITGFIPITHENRPRLLRILLKPFKDQFQLDQRPHVGISDIAFGESFRILKLLGQSVKRKPTPKGEQVMPHIGEPLFVDVKIKNFGRSPALNIVSHRHLLFGPKAHYKIEHVTDPQTGTILESGDTQAVTAVSVKDTYSVESIQVDPSEFVAWDGSEPIVVFGRIIYEDSFGNRYCTPYAWQYLPEGMMWEILPMTGRLEVVQLCPEGTHR